VLLTEASLLANGHHACVRSIRHIEPAGIHLLQSTVRNPTGYNFPQQSQHNFAEMPCTRATAASPLVAGRKVQTLDNPPEAMLLITRLPTDPGWLKGRRLLLTTQAAYRTKLAEKLAVV
jgi:hypothetical protein